MHNKIIYILGVLVIIAIGTFIFNKSALKQSTQTQVETADKNKIYADLNGDGEKEYIMLDMPADDSSSYLQSIKVYDRLDNVIASLSSEITIKVPMSDSLKVHKLNKNDPRESFSLDFIAGPHQSETMFFELYKDMILPICFKVDVTGPYDCLFYSGNVGYLPIVDLNNDGFMELIETTDEYPGDGQLSSEEKAAIDKVFSGTDSAEGMERIAIREKGGRGRKVIWTIYSFNGEYFVPQIGGDYDKYYDLIGDSIKNKMKKSELSKESLDYIEFVRSFWSRRPQ